MLLRARHMAMNVHDDLTHAFLQTSRCGAVIIAVLRLRLRNHQLNERRLLLVLIFVISCCIVFVLISRIVVFKVRPDSITCSGILIVLLFLLILLI